MSAAFTGRLDDVARSALDQLAEKTERSRDWLVARAIEEVIATNTWQVGKIEAGMEAADRGHFASDADLARVRKKFAAQV